MALGGGASQSSGLNSAHGEAFYNPLPPLKKWLSKNILAKGLEPPQIRV